MNQFKTSDLKRFTNELFVGDIFDNFLLKEAKIITSNSYIIDGTINRDFYQYDEIEELIDKELVCWGKNKKICYEIIKGNKLPLEFKIILKYNSVMTSTILKKNGIHYGADTPGLYLNILYTNGEISCISACAISIFDKDKLIEKMWDEYMFDFVKNNRLI